jgi:hypothetical protein
MVGRLNFNCAHVRELSMMVYRFQYRSKSVRNSQSLPQSNKIKTCLKIYVGSSCFKTRNRIKLDQFSTLLDDNFLILINEINKINFYHFETNYSVFLYSLNISRYNISESLIFFVSIPDWIAKKKI